MKDIQKARRWPALLWRLAAVPTTLLLTVWVAWLGAWLPDRSWRPQGGPDGVPVAAGWPPSVANEDAGDGEGWIPQDAIRLRIIANSDAPGDQALKREVRDRVLQVVSRALKGASSTEEARRRLQALVPEVQREAEEVVRRAGYTYPVRADYGLVPFPTKMYGDQVYPAGDYEALRIVLGNGLGQNWWCVLFPPLCFVDLTNGDAVPTFQERGGVTTVQLPGTDGTKHPVLVRWLIGDLFIKVVEWLRHMR